MRKYASGVVRLSKALASRSSRFPGQPQAIMHTPNFIDDIRCSLSCTKSFELSTILILWTLIT